MVITLRSYVRRYYIDISDISSFWELINRVTEKEMNTGGAMLNTGALWWRICVKLYSVKNLEKFKGSSKIWCILDGHVELTYILSNKFLKSFNYFRITLCNVIPCFG
jgi:hypothetical protein